MSILLAALYAACGVAGYLAVLVTPFGRVESILTRWAFLVVGFGGTVAILWT